MFCVFWLSSSCILCVQYFQCLLVVLSWLLLRFSLTFVRYNVFKCVVGSIRNCFLHHNNIQYFARMPLVEKELLTLPEHLSPFPVLVGSFLCCDVNVKAMFASSLLPLFSRRFIFYLLFLLHLVCPIFPVPFGCPFLIAPSVFSYVCSLQRIQVYINKYTIFDLTILYFLQNKTALVIKSEAPRMIDNTMATHTKNYKQRLTAQKTKDRSTLTPLQTRVNSGTLELPAVKHPFYGRYHDLVNCNGIPVSQITTHMFRFPLSQSHPFLVQTYQRMFNCW
jgi:hypothetical protein